MRTGIQLVESLHDRESVSQENLADIAAQITLQSHLDDLKGLRNMATKASQYSPAISAEVARGKASGLYIEKIQATHTGNITTIKRVIIDGRINNTDTPDI